MSPDLFVTHGASLPSTPLKKLGVFHSSAATRLVPVPSGGFHAVISNLYS